MLPTHWVLSLLKCYLHPAAERTCADPDCMANLTLDIPAAVLFASALFAPGWPAALSATGCRCCCLLATSVLTCSFCSDSAGSAALSLTTKYCAIEAFASRSFFLGLQSFWLLLGRLLPD